ncbi:LLM class flavin-dependent oxidoreductase [Bailinhaonella thermotolerans]|uniref:LLM class flavin-dependent oxidoreductase n=1 Tax=Bailinhaonella thermotolerans TaxID=1070861 RepID=A0A3A4B1G5_9ACTN|nr:LLM class flavin-dependent oxidoreductase [Bailinhaonella thermotolerans]RJL35575.1 LLM class flavin-dependent oxidoreductase [Bailinhaonella thermotolerans]
MTAAGTRAAEPAARRATATATAQAAPARADHATPRFHVILPTRSPAPADLPAFVTDVRPEPADPARGAAVAADLSGWAGALVPFDPDGHESLTVAAGALRHTRHLRVIAEFHPAAATPVYAAKLSASLQRFSAGRLGWRLAVDLDPAVARAQGDFLTGPARHARADEFLTVAKAVWQGGPVDFHGDFYQVAAGGFGPPLSSPPFPEVHLSGTSPHALELSRRHADVHVFSAGDDLAALIPELPGLRYGVRLTSIDDADDYAALGVTEFFLRTEDVYRLGEHVKERARDR